MNIKLVELSYEYKSQLEEMLPEWIEDIEKNNGNHSPWAIFKNDYKDFDYYLENLDFKEVVDGHSPTTTLFCLDLDRNIFVGAVNIRHILIERIRLTGGHIGDGIRPSERRKGYATAMIGLALEECKKLGINKVLMTCSKNNIGSAKSIMNNGGILESEIEEDGELEQRYWITLNEESFETERMNFRRIMPSDYKEMAAWTSDERVYTYLFGNAVTDPEAVLPFLRNNDPNSKEHMVWIAHAKEDNRPLGVFACVYKEEADRWEISYSLRYDDWNKGFATEAAKGTMDYAVEHCGARKFMAECADENLASGRVMEKLGMKYDHASSYSKKDGSRTFCSRVYYLEVS